MYDNPLKQATSLLKCLRDKPKKWESLGFFCRHLTLDVQRTYLQSHLMNDSEKSVNPHLFHCILASKEEVQFPLVERRVKQACWQMAPLRKGQGDHDRKFPV